MRLCYPAGLEFGCYPVAVAEADGINARDLVLIQGVDAALDHARRISGHWLACRPGCTPCCRGFIPINSLDARRLRQGLADLEARDPESAARVRARAREAAARIPADLIGDPRLLDLEDDNLCPALDPDSGLCDLYEARPMVCREFGPAVRTGSGSLGICELCFEGASDAEIAACEVVPDPAGLERSLLLELEKSVGANGETLITLCLAE